MRGRSARKRVWVDFLADCRVDYGVEDEQFRRLGALRFLRRRVEFSRHLPELGKRTGIHLPIPTPATAVTSRTVVFSNPSSIKTRTNASWSACERA
jgi:hypothetical protein